MSDIKPLLQAMWENYLALNPDARRIHDLFAELNDGVVVNDHIALRTFALEPVRLEAIARPFLEAGYLPGEDYEFKAKKLRARHFYHPDDTLPKVFISELKVDELSERAQGIIKGLAEQIDPAALAQDSFSYSGRHWSLDYGSYQELLQESEYAAWMAALGYRPNHFTVSINHLKSHETLQSVNDTLQQAGFVLNSSGGLIKGTPEIGLEQSSTMANKAEVEFSDQTAEIPTCFYEFALRHPVADGQLYQGFVAASADKIFESTNVK
ncbi:2-oxoadipate dioxygenase/decarboxylase family protein [Spongorhabdus nitratireducens]